MIQVQEINKDTKIPYEVDEATKAITFNSKLTINLEEEQKNVEKVIDISLDKDRNLIKGLGKWYVANIIIPPAEYGLIDSGETDEQGYPVKEEIKLPFFVENVKLVLWKLPEGYES